MFEKLKQIHIIVLLGIIVFTAGGSWTLQKLINDTQNEDIQEIKSDIRLSLRRTRTNESNLLKLAGKLDVTNERLKSNNEKMDMLLDKL